MNHEAVIWGTLDLQGLARCEVEAPINLVDAESRFVVAAGLQNQDPMLVRLAALAFVHWAVGVPVMTVAASALAASTVAVATAYRASHADGVSNELLPLTVPPCDDPAEPKLQSPSTIAPDAVWT